jgi:hypothetical protein
MGACHNIPNIRGEGRTELGWMSPGDHYEAEIEVRNAFSTDRTLEVKATPFSMSDDNSNDYDYITKKVRTTLSEWISFPGGHEYLLSPGEIRSIKYVIDIPIDWRIGGGQSAAINFDYGNSSINASGDNTIVMESSFAWLLRANLSGEQLREEGEVISWDMGQILFDNSKGVNSDTVVKNSGNVNFEMNNRVVINKFFSGDEVYNQEKTGTVLAESQWKSNLNWDGAPALGLFNVTNEVEFLGQAQFSETRWVLLIPIWLLVIIIAIIALLVAALIIKIRNHREGK